jgi:hypothetical protein
MLLCDNYKTGLEIKDVLRINVPAGFDEGSGVCPPNSLMRACGLQKIHLDKKWSLTKKLGSVF